jgi:hypothetical protein
MTLFSTFTSISNNGYLIVVFDHQIPNVFLDDVHRSACLWKRFSPDGKKLLQDRHEFFNLQIRPVIGAFSQSDQT